MLSIYLYGTRLQPIKIIFYVEALPAEKSNLLEHFCVTKTDNM